MFILKITVHHSYSNIVIPPFFQISFEENLLATLPLQPKPRAMELFYCNKLYTLKWFIQCLLILYPDFSCFIACKQIPWRACCSADPWFPLIHSDSVDLGWSLKMYISNSHTGGTDPHTVGPYTTP